MDGVRRGDPAHLLVDLEHWRPFIADAERALQGEGDWQLPSPDDYRIGEDV